MKGNDGKPLTELNYEFRFLYFFKIRKPVYGILYIEFNINNWK